MLWLGASFAAIAEVTAGDVRAAESNRYSTSGALFDYAYRLTQRLSADTDPPVILDTIALLARACVELGHGDKALPALTEAITFATLVNDPMRTASLKQLRARAKYFMGIENEALQESTDAIAAQRAVAPTLAEHPDPTRLVDELLEHAAIQQALGGDAQAISALRLAERLMPLSRTRVRHEIAFEHGFAEIMKSFADHDAARKRLQNALTKAESANELGWRMELLSALATSEVERGDLDTAERIASRHLQAALELNSRLGEANARLILSEILRLRGDNARAYEYARASSQIYDSLDDAFTRAGARREMALAAASLGRVDEARRLLEEILQLRPENSSVYWSYRVAQLRTQIAIASKDPKAAIAAHAAEELLSNKRLAHNTGIQVRALREYHDVNARELELEALMKKNAISEVVIVRDKTRIFWQRVAILASLATLFAVAVALYILARRASALRRAAETDALTGVKSRAAILADASARYANALTSGESLAVCVVDIDRFKQFNDSYGHAVGDRVLVHCVDLMRKSLRKYDAVGRIGGDEFLMVMRAVDENEAHAIIDRIVESIARHPIEHDGTLVYVSVSAGIAAFVPSRESTVKQLIQRADRALLSAKQHGKNRVVRFSLLGERTVMGVV